MLGVLRKFHARYIICHMLYGSVSGTISGNAQVLDYLQVIQMHSAGSVLVFVVPCALPIVNLMWFGKIIKGLVKMLAKHQ